MFVQYKMKGGERMDYVVKNYYWIDYKIYKDGTIVGPKRGIVSQRKNEDGYMEVTLGATENRHSRVKVHRVIAEAFVQNPNNLPEVNHIDYDRSNNNADNLEWCSHIDNVRHSSNVGHYKNKSGTSNGRANLDWNKVRSLRRMYGNGIKISEISNVFNIPYSTVFNVVHNKTWIE